MRTGFPRARAASPRHSPGRSGAPSPHGGGGATPRQGARAVPGPGPAADDVANSSAEAEALALYGAAEPGTLVPYESGGPGLWSRTSPGAREPGSPEVGLGARGSCGPQTCTGSRAPRTAAGGPRLRKLPAHPLPHACGNLPSGTAPYAVPLRPPHVRRITLREILGMVSVVPGRGPGRWCGRTRLTAHRAPAEPEGAFQARKAKNDMSALSTIHIDGAWRAAGSGATREVLDPADATVLAVVAEGGRRTPTRRSRRRGAPSTTAPGRTSPSPSGPPCCAGSPTCSSGTARRSRSPRAATPARPSKRAGSTWTT